MGFVGLDFDYFDFEKYPTYFDDESFITLAQAGTYTGPAAMEEYVRFVSDSSPYFDVVEAGPMETKLKGIDGDVCIFSLSAIGRYTSSDYLVDEGSAVDVASHSKIFYNAFENYIEKIHVYYEVGYLDYLFDYQLDNSNLYEFLCKTMESPCGLDIYDGGNIKKLCEKRKKKKLCEKKKLKKRKKNKLCEKKLKKLPTFNDGSYVDGDSFGCRALHGVFAATNPSLHCAHIAFEPFPDTNGKTKCSVTEGVVPDDLFDTDDINQFKTFCEVNGIDPSEGYTVLSKKGAKDV